MRRLSRRGRARGHIGPLTNITRQPGAWSVQVGRKGVIITGWYADAVWGGRQRAQVAAQHFRDELLQRIDPDIRVRQQAPKGTRSGTRVVGVSLERHVVDGRVYQRYVAAWPDGQGGNQRCRFLVEHYGRKRARRLAIDARKGGVAETHRKQLARQREEAAKRLRNAPPRPAQVKDPRSREGISMARRRPRRRPVE